MFIFVRLLVRVRRDDPSQPAPNLGMRAAALALALLVKGNLEAQIPERAPPSFLDHAAQLGCDCARGIDVAAKEKNRAAAAAAGGEAAAGGSKDAEAGASGSNGPEAMAEDGIPSAAAAAVAQFSSMPLVRMGQHLNRLAEEVHMALFDSRRRSCHALILNYFVAVGGLDALAARFGDAVDALWAAMDMPAAAAAAAAPTASATTGTDVVMSDVQAPAAGAATPGAGSASGTTGAAAPAPLAPSHVLSPTSKRHPKMLAEKAMQSFLSVYELMSSATLIFSASHAQHMLSAALPPSAGPAAAAQLKDPAALMRAIQASIVSALAPVWRSERLARSPPAIMAQVVSVLNSCAEGTAAAAAHLLRASAREGRGAGAGGRGGFQPDPELLSMMAEMGFSQARAELALRRVGVNNIETAMEWLLLHPEEPPAAGAAGAARAAGAAAAGAAAAGQAPEAPPRSEDDEFADALAASLEAIGLSADQLQPPAAAAAAASTAAGPSTAPAAADAAAGTSAATATAAAAAAATAAGTSAATAKVVPPQPSAATSLLGTTAMVEGAVAILSRSPSAATAFSMADLLYTLAVKEKEEGREGGAVVAALMELYRCVAWSTAVYLFCFVLASRDSAVVVVFVVVS